ncbi:MAG TPA: hypothetical protein OIM42_04860 [Clostridiaceae bacterium]|nr:hypothetical protein [Clostridiaceae bacterium]
MKENSIKEDIEILEKNIKSVKENADMAFFESDEDYCFFKAVEHILSAYKKILKENEILKEEKEQAWEEWNSLEQGSYEIEQKLKQQIKESQKENEELKKDYYNVINKIENKIDRFDYEFKKAKRQNNKDKSDYYWDLIKNLKKLLESEE